MLKASIQAQIRSSGRLQKLVSNIRRAMVGKHRVKVGFPSGKTSGDIISRAVWMEFGTSRGIPERPFLRNAMASNLGKYKSAMRQQAVLIMQGSGTVERALDKLGQEAVADVKRSIGSNTPPPLKAATIKAKGSSKTLIDTGEMRNSVNYEAD